MFFQLGVRRSLRAYASIWLIGANISVGISFFSFLDERAYDLLAAMAKVIKLWKICILASVFLS